MSVVASYVADAFLGHGAVEEEAAGPKSQCPDRQCKHRLPAVLIEIKDRICPRFFSMPFVEGKVRVDGGIAGVR